MGFLSILEMLNIGLRFILELVGLTLYGYCGYRMGTTPLGKGILSIIIPIAVAFIWALFGSPQANFPLPPFVHLLLELVIFLLPVVLLIRLEKTQVAFIYGGIFIINRVLLFYWHS
ncbi:YrdB family protein [Rummeliibacillus pycnus]|uniref:YrdB family protein n=1 Tax=Rummeliibacillus pycnus TaxID=101070 RepID=UPI003D2AF1CC